MLLNQIVLDQKQELIDGLNGKRIIEREAKNQFNKTVDSKLIKVISGIRRCGKSVFTNELLNGKDFAYLNFDDDRLISVETEKILPTFYELYGKSVKTIFFDEIQNLKNWELFANRLHRNGFNLFLTGSNSKLLSKELASRLTGRHLTIELFPFSFREYLSAIDFKENIETTKGQSLLKRELKNYSKNGGFPEIVVEKENPKTYLRELYRKIIERDIIDRYNVSYKKTFKEIALTLTSNPARRTTYNRIKKQFQLGSEHTAKNYLSYLEEAYILFYINKLSFKPIEVEKSEKKVYSIDSGLTNNVSIQLNEEQSHIHENQIAIELQRKKALNQNIEIYYWKNVQQEEVDFAIKNGLKIKQLIQACYNPEEVETKKRETKALIKASKELKCKNLLIITNDFESEEKINNKKIKYVPLWKWLLEEKN